MPEQKFPPCEGGTKRGQISTERRVPIALGNITEALWEGFPDADSQQAEGLPVWSALQRVGVDYIKCKTWTTDAPYRETRDKVNRRLAQGCLTVEMEAAALFAVAQFRNVEFGQILFAGDDLSGEVWDHRGYTTHTSGREKLFWLAAECCAEL